MEIRYSNHLLIRIKMRGIPYDLPCVIYQRAPQRFHDTESGVDIAVARDKYAGKMRLMAVAYRLHPSYISLITIHPLKPHQLENRISSGRWKELG